MKLFLPNGFRLDPHAGDYTSAVLQLGDEAEKNMIEFMRLHGSNRKFGSGLKKKLVELKTQGAFDKLIKAYRVRISVGKITYPAPDCTTDVF